MAENTNNSLSDLNNENRKFNRLLKDSDINKLNQNQDENTALNTENNGLRSKIQNVKPVDKNKLSTKIESNQNKINNNTDNSANLTSDEFKSISI